MSDPDRAALRDELCELRDHIARRISRIQANGNLDPRQCAIAKTETEKGIAMLALAIEDAGR